jgi:aspartokinase-like uncharacterized kinase
MTGPQADRLVRVVKVGGSLLEWPLLPEMLQHWLAAQPLAVNVLIAGGGELAEAIRRADEALHLGEETSHWLCIDVLGITAQMLAAALKCNEPESSWHRLCAQLAKKSGSVVFDPRSFLREIEPQLSGCLLPRDWSVTSDSIAARVAEALGAGELVLLKSRDAPTGDWQELAQIGYVDCHFSRAVATLPRVRTVNLRGEVRRESPANTN